MDAIGQAASSLGPSAVPGDTAPQRVDPQWAWARYEPGAQSPWNLSRAGHLYLRAAFGGTWEQLQQALRDGPQRTLDRLLRPSQDVESFDRTHDDYEKSGGDSNSADNLRTWWVRRLMFTPHPLQEKLVLFWHGHFAAGIDRVKSSLLLHRYVRLLRQHALGRYDALLASVCQEPAVLLELGAELSFKARPNENLAQALLDHYGPGPGNYSETDVRETARAFTGWTVLRDKFRYVPAQHDDGTKKILGQSGPWSGEDAIRLVASHSATSQAVVRKLYRFLISETEEPGNELVAPLAEMFAEEWNLSRLVETMLRSNLFFSPTAHRQRIKSPAEFALGIVRGLEGVVGARSLGEHLADLGQNLGHPPTFRGWPGGRSWLNTVTLLTRCNLAQALIANTGPYKGQLDPMAVAQKHGFQTPEAAARFLMTLFLQDDLAPERRHALTEQTPKSAQDVRPFLHALLTTPEFQLA